MEVFDRHPNIDSSIIKSMTLINSLYLWLNLLTHGMKIPWPVSLIYVPIYFFTETVRSSVYKFFEVIDAHVFPKNGILLPSLRLSSQPQTLHSVFDFGDYGNHYCIRLFDYTVRIICIWNHKNECNNVELCCNRKSYKINDICQ